MQYNPSTNTFNEAEAPADGTLPHVMWHITDVCPLNCGFCFSPKSDRSISLAKTPLIISRLRALGAQKIDIAGGEPCMFADLPAIINSVRESGIYCTVTTSGVGRRGNIDYLASNIQELSRLIVSIDAVDIHHDELRKFAGAWSAAMKLISSVSPDLRQRLVRVNTVITKPLLTSDGLQPLAEAISRLDVHEWCLIEPHPANAKPHFMEHEISSAEFGEACTLIRSEFPDIKLLARPRDLYSSYWVLHPDGMLRQHSETESDGPGIDLTESTIASVKAQISKTKTRLPN